MFEKETDVVCGKCGVRNAPVAKYCSNCGGELLAPAELAFSGLDGLSLVHLAGSLYVLVSALFNWNVDRDLYKLLVGSDNLASVLLLVPYLVTGGLGLIASYEFGVWSRVKMRKLVVLISATATAVGLGSTFALFYLGLAYLGFSLQLVGPAWVIFLVNAWKLWTDRKRFRTSL